MNHFGIPSRNEWEETRKLQLADAIQKGINEGVAVDLISDFCLLIDELREIVSK